MRRFIDFKGHMAPDSKVRRLIIEFFKEHSIKEKELVYVDTNFEDSDLPQKLGQLVNGKQGGTITDGDTTIIVYEFKFPLVTGFLNGQMWFVLHKEKALSL